MKEDFTNAAAAREPSTKLLGFDLGALANGGIPDAPDLL